MKKVFTLSAVLLALGASALIADSNVTLSNVHLCCPSCVKGVDKALSGVTGITAHSDKEAGTVALTAPDNATAQKAVDALVAGGYFGKSSNPAITVKAHSGAKKGKVQSLKVAGVHLCCAKCVTGMTEALNKVEGVKANTATKGSETFEVTGDFSAEEVFTALNKAGFAGKVSKEK